MQYEPIIYSRLDIPPFKMIHVPGGSFIMGDGSYYDNPAHEVRMNDFYLCESPVTQDLYQTITQNNPSHFKGSHHPIEMVSWYNAVEFCNLLSEELGLEKVYTIDKETKDIANTSVNDKIKWLVKTTNEVKGFRLPTEVEWEYAAQGGAFTTYSGSDRIEQIGWFNGNNGMETREVGLKFPNQLGIYDMSGNVFEWCWDWYGDCRQKDKDNLVGTKTGLFRVLRGGCWSSYASGCRIVNRDRYSSNGRHYFMGFRVALSL